MKKLKVAVIFGSKSSEYLVSLHSVTSVIKNISHEKYDVTLIGITEQGKWLYFPGTVEEIDNNTWFENPGCCEMILSPDATLKGFIKLNNDNTYEHLSFDCVFPVLHGKNGEDGTIQGLCDLSGIAYVGCDLLSSAVCMDKEFAHIICENSGIKMAPYMAVLNDENLNVEKLYKEVEEKLSIPVFIKPANAGSSYGVSKAKNFEDFKSGLEFAFEHDRKIIIEKSIEGFEIGCAVLGNDDIRVGEIDEIEMYGDFFDYEEKYHTKESKIHCPARISPEFNQKAKEMARKTYKALGCSGFARVDMFICNDGELYLNEVNTIPGMTNTSRYPTMAKVGLGLDFKALIEELIDLAMKKNSMKK